MFGIENVTYSFVEKQWAMFNEKAIVLNFLTGLLTEKKFYVFMFLFFLFQLSINTCLNINENKNISRNKIYK